ncbi:Fanconi anemia group D2 protein, partial [Ophiophagus hannah]
MEGLKASTSILTATICCTGYRYSIVLFLKMYLGYPNHDMSTPVMASKRKLFKPHFYSENLIEELPKTKRPRTSGKKKTVLQDDDIESNNVFGHLLKTAGITLKAGEKQNEIDGAIFQKKLHQALRKHPSYPQMVAEFISGLDSHIENRDQFRNCLLPCIPAQNQETNNAVHSYCESLIKLLLGIEILQPAVIKLLFEKLPEFFQESVGSDGLNLPRLIVNQLKWLDRIGLVSMIMQMVYVSPPSIQHDIITSLPEILEDSQHSEIAKQLSPLLKENIGLTVPVLDALSCLNLDVELLSEIRQSVMSSVSAVKVEDLPVIVKFILHSMKATEATEVIFDLRKKLNLESCAALPSIQASQSKLSSQAQSSLSASQMSINKDSFKLLFEVLKSALKFQKCVLEGWIKAIENIPTASDHKVLDMIMLLIIYATSTKNKKQIERLLKSKIQSGCLREQLLQNTFRYHSLVMRDLFPAILSVAESFVNSADPCVVSFGSCMYKQAFTAFDSYCQQEIVGALVTHICGGNKVEVDVSLDTLTDLVSVHTSSVVSYVVFLKDDMHMVIRKQLSSTIPKYKRIGIIGAVTMIITLLELVFSCCGQDPHALALYYDELANLIQKGNLDLQILAWIKDYVVQDFESDFVTDLLQIEDSTFPFPVKALYGLEDGESEGGIAIKLLPLLSQSFSMNVDVTATESKDVRLVSPICLSPFFRMLRLCMSELNKGSMEDIDALLVCPLYLTSLEVAEKIESLSKEEREFLCSLLFHAVNWFREVVNAFCREEDPNMKGKVLTRLQNITELQCTLEKCLAERFRIQYDTCNKQQHGHNLFLFLGQKRLKSDSSKNSFGDSSQVDENLEIIQTEAETSQEKSSSPEKDPGAPLIQLQNYSAYFRELDLEVFTILHCGLLTKSVLDSEMHTKFCAVNVALFLDGDTHLQVFSVPESFTGNFSLSEFLEIREVVQLEPTELLFLLEDLYRKMEHMLIPAPARRTPFLKGKGNKNAGFSHLCQSTSQEVIEYAAELLKPLCNHIENIHNHFQMLIAENHGVIDGPGVNIQEHQLMSSCYQRLLQIFHFLFAWNGFSQHENHGLLKASLHILACRLKPGDGELPLEDLLSQSFQYLLNFQHNIPNIYCALSLTQLLLVIAEKSVANPKRKEIASITKGFLCQSWMQPSGTRQKGSQFNDALHTLLTIYMEYTHDILKEIENISSTGVPELIRSSKDGYSSSYPTLT